MGKKGLSRPGALQMVASAILTLVASVGPTVIALTRSSHEWSLFLAGFPALALSLSGVVVFLLYVVGFLRYCSNKGYSKWLGLFLFLGNVPGLISLLLLPDISMNCSEKPESAANKKAVVSAK